MTVLGSSPAPYDARSARVSAEGVLRRALIEYWRSTPPGSLAYLNSRPLDVIPIFGQYAAQLLEIEVREQVVSDPEYYPKQAIASVLISLRPSPEAGTPGDVIWMQDTIGEFQRRGGSGVTLGRLMVVAPEGAWEELIQISWGEAAAGIVDAPPRHPFQFALRQSFNGRTFVQRIGPFIDAKVRELEMERRARNIGITNLTRPQKTDKSGIKRAKPGPRPDPVLPDRVSGIVRGITGGTGWKDQLDNICDALDEANIPVPKTWSRREPKIRNWMEAASTEPDLAKKAIEYRLKRARN